MLKGIQVNGYVSQAGNPTFVYRVEGCTEEQLEAYKAFKGSNYRSELAEIDGKVVECPLVWSQDGMQDEVVIRVTPKGDLRIDNTQMLKLQGFMNRNKQFAGAIASEIAKNAVASLNIFGDNKATVRQVSAVEPEKAKTEGAKDLSDL